MNSSKVNSICFHYRGTLHLKSLKPANVSSRFKQLPLPASNLTSLKMSAKYGGYYFIRAKSKLKFTDFDDSSDYVITFISAVS